MPAAHGRSTRPRGEAVDVTRAERQEQVALSTRCRASIALRVLERRQPPDRPAAGAGRRPRRRPACRSPRRARPRAARGPDRRRAPRPRPRAPARARTRGAGAACASRGAAGTRRSAAAAPARGRPAASPRPRSDGGRSRRTRARRRASPTGSNRRAGGPEAGQRAAASSSRQPAASRGASAASAFRTLCSPGTGSSTVADRLARRAASSKRMPVPVGSIVARPSVGARAEAEPHHPCVRRDARTGARSHTTAVPPRAGAPGTRRTPARSSSSDA